jgi:hypothetical protein
MAEAARATAGACTAEAAGATAGADTAEAAAGEAGTAEEACEPSPSLSAAPSADLPYICLGPRKKKPQKQP